MKFKDLSKLSRVCKDTEFKGIYIEMFGRVAEEVIIRNKDHIIRMIDRDPLLGSLKVKRMSN